MVYDPWGIFPSKNTICVSWVCNILRRNNMVWFFCTLVAFQVIMWKSKEFEDIWWCKNQINIRCQSGFGRGYNHCDRYVTVKAEKIQFLKRRIFQKKKKFQTSEQRIYLRLWEMIFFTFWCFDSMTKTMQCQLWNKFQTKSFDFDSKGKILHEFPLFCGLDQGICADIHFLKFPLFYLVIMNMVIQQKSDKKI